MTRERRIWLGAVALVALVVWFLGVRAFRPDHDAGPCVVTAGPVSLPEIPESSGLAVSRRTPGMLWSHNDSGHAAVLFAIDPVRGVRGRVPVPIQTRDWEDVSAAPCPAGDCLYVADIGDNQLSRRSVRIYRVPEPAPGDGQTAPAEVFTAVYEDGRHNAEALFVVGMDLYIVAKDRTAGVYRASTAPPAGHDLTFQRISELRLLAVTDAETSADGASVAVRTSHEVAVYRTADITRGTAVPIRRIPINGLREPQGEGVALDGPMLFLSSEGQSWSGGGSVLALRCATSTAIQSLSRSKN